MDGTSLLKRLFLTSFKDRLDHHPALRAALDDGLPPLGEHDEMIRLINSVNRDVTDGLVAAIAKSVDDASFTALFEAIAAILAQQFLPSRKNFAPLMTIPLPCYAELQLSLPPVLEILEWADRQQFDVIHVSTPGPMGLCGLLAAKMLRAPVIGTYHTDFPVYADKLTGDHRVANGTRVYIE